MDRPLDAHTLNEVQYYLTVTPCGRCGKGPLVMETSGVPAGADRSAAVETHCKQCGEKRSFTFRCEYEVPPDEPESHCINPTNSPSRIIDLAQWLSLFYMLVESAASAPAKPDTRRTGYKAALCLAEALKFYGADELPPESAFFSPATAQAFRDHPEKFTRQRLRDMQAKLPALPKMARKVARDRQTAKRKWWRFWRR